jgi:hypothetical protein
LAAATFNDMQQIAGLNSRALIFLRGAPLNSENKNERTAPVITSPTRSSLFRRQLSQVAALPLALIEPEIDDVVAFLAALTIRNTKMPATRNTHANSGYRR